MVQPTQLVLGTPSQRLGGTQPQISAALRVFLGANMGVQDYTNALGAVTAYCEGKISQLDAEIKKAEGEVEHCMTKIGNPDVSDQDALSKSTIESKAVKDPELRAAIKEALESDQVASPSWWDAIFGTKRYWENRKAVGEEALAGKRQQKVTAEEEKLRYAVAPKAENLTQLISEADQAVADVLAQSGAGRWQALSIVLFLTTIAAVGVAIQRSVSAPPLVRAFRM